VDLVEVCLFTTLYMESQKNTNAARHRYNTFMVLYPLGISSECWLVYQAIAPASQIDERLGYALWAILAIYVPGSYILFTHMLKQRRRIQKSA
jgi:very-long-chain (3R)-3-hydroxyacyl-CoA dehydratase